MILLLPIANYALVEMLNHATIFQWFRDSAYRAVNSCPYCLSVWTAAGLTLTQDLVWYNFIVVVLSTHALSNIINDFLYPVIRKEKR